MKLTVSLGVNTGIPGETDSSAQYLQEAYEDKHFPIAASTPGRMLAFYMDQHGHKQKDLSDIATQSVISEILSGKRVPTVEQVKKLAKKYHTDPSVFL